MWLPWCAWALLLLGHIIFGARIYQVKPAMASENGGATENGFATLPNLGGCEKEDTRTVAFVKRCARCSILQKRGLPRQIIILKYSL